MNDKLYRLEDATDEKFAINVCGLVDEKGEGVDEFSVGVIHHVFIKEIGSSGILVANFRR